MCSIIGKPNNLNMAYENFEHKNTTFQRVIDTQLSVKKTIPKSVQIVERPKTSIKCISDPDRRIIR